MVLGTWLWVVLQVGAEADVMVPVARAVGGIERGDGETLLGVAGGEAQRGWGWG